MLGSQIRVIAYNIRSLWNVGSFFRTCDALGVEKLYLTGYTACPPRREITKVALGAEASVPWEYAEEPLDVLKQLKNKGWMLVSLEQGSTSIPLIEFKPQFPLCLIVGNEVGGVCDDLLALSDTIIHIPMLGSKESLNVAVAAGIALYTLRHPATLGPTYGRSSTTPAATEAGRSRSRGRD